jgi:hypothetical protein
MEKIAMTSDENTNVRFDSFMDHKKMVMTLVTDLKKLQDFSQNLKLDKSVVLIDEILKRIETQVFSIAIVGEFRRGKSTFINTLIGKDILPSDILPTSATLNRVTYGVKPAVKILFKDGHEEEIPIDKLSDYVTKLTPESEKTAGTIQESIVYYPVPYCQNNIDIIDTPGLNDEQGMTDITVSVLPQVDTAILVIASHAPLSEVERDFVENKLLTNDLGRIIFVVNMWDNFTQEQADRILQHVKSQIKKYIFDRAKDRFGEDSEQYQLYLKKIGDPKVFGLYIKQALAAKQSGDDRLLAQSRFPEFEQALEKFLTQERGAILLQVPVNRVISSSQEILANISIQENALKMKQEDFQRAYENSVAEIASIRARQTNELKLIDAAADKFIVSVRPIIRNLPDRFKAAAEEAIQSISIEPKEVNNKKVLSKKLSDTVSNALERASDNLSQKIQDQTQEAIDREVERLKDFAKAVENVFTKINIEFGGIEANSDRKTTGKAEAITIALSTVTGLGGIWSGYRVAGAKGSILGGAASLGTLTLAGLMTSALGLTVATVGAPAMLLIAIGTVVTSFIAGRGVTEMAFGRERVENFKKDYQEKVLQQIDEQLKEKNLEDQIYERITLPFENIKKTLSQEVEALLDNTHQTLTDLSDRRGRQEAMTESKRQELNQIRTQTERILGNAQGLNKQLVEIMSV